METHDNIFEEEKQANPQTNQEQPQEKPIEVNTDQKNEAEEKEKDDWVIFDSFGKVGNVVLTILMSLLGFGLMIFVGWLIIHFVALGYNHWFGHIDGEEIGKNGLVYVEDKCVIMKTCPNRTALENITYLEKNTDTLGIVEYEGKYGILNYNDASFIVTAQYDMLWNKSANIYVGICRDSAFTFTIPSGEIIKRESAECLYTDISALSLPIYELLDFEDDNDDFLFFEYTNYADKKGIMNRNYEMVTPAIYSDIKVINSNAFFCQFDDPVETIGELIDSTGNRIIICR